MTCIEGLVEPMKRTNQKKTKQPQPMPWIKLWVDPCLEGTVRVALEPDERGVWYDLMLLAARCGGRNGGGRLERAEGFPYSREEIGDKLNISEELTHRAIDKFLAQGRLTIGSGDTLFIANWKSYQVVPDHVKHARARKKKLDEANRDMEAARKEVARCERVVHDAMGGATSSTPDDDEENKGKGSAGPVSANPDDLLEEE